MSLITHIYATPDRDTLLYTLTDGFSFSTGEHGYRSWNATLDVGQDEAQTIYNWPGVPHVECIDEATETIFEGRLEDIAISGGQVTLGAFGYFRALTDVPYTALWSKTGSGDWRAATEDEIVISAPSRFEMDNNNRVYIAVRKGEESSAGSRGIMAYLLPDGGERNLSTIAFDYIFEPSGGVAYTAIVRGFSDSWTQLSSDTIVNDSSSDSGSYSFTFPAGVTRVAIVFNRASATPHEHTDETGASGFFKATNIRIKTTTSSTVLASDIAAALATFVNGVNSDQLSASAALIEATTTDLQDELYEDRLPADILDRLALLHGYETGVYGGRRLYFRERGSAGRDWFVNVKGVLEAQRSLDRVANSVYGVYRDAGGRTLRTSVSDDNASQSRFGMTRRDYVNVQTTSQTEAEAHRDAMLEDRADDFPRISIEVDHLEDAAGGRWPLYHVRAGDTVTFRDLLPYALSADDRMSSFEVGETEYRTDQPGQIKIVSREPLPTLEVLVSRREAGIR